MCKKRFNTLFIALMLLSFMGCGKSSSQKENVNNDNPSPINISIKETNSDTSQIQSIVLEVYNATDINDETYINKSIIQTAILQKVDSRWNVQIEGLTHDKAYIFLIKAYKTTETKTENIIFTGIKTQEVTQNTKNIEIALTEHENVDNTEQPPYITDFNTTTQSDDKLILSFTIHNPNEHNLKWEIRNIETNETSSEFSTNLGNMNSLSKKFTLDYLVSISNKYLLIVTTQDSVLNYPFSINKETNIVTPPVNISNAIIKKTLQIKSYDELGDENNSSKDDGDYQKGQIPSYERNSTSTIVTDKVTKLMWQDNNNTLLKWEQADEYCDNSTLGGFNDWRLPTTSELDTIVAYYPTDTFSTTHPVLLDDIFEQRGTSTPKTKYWSSFKYQGVQNTNRAWYVDFTSGNHGDSTGNREGAYHVRCTRGTMTKPTFHKEITTGIVTDTLNNLEWQDNGVFIAESWNDALNRCENLVLGEAGNEKGWRLPNVNELKSLVKRTNTPRIHESFTSHPDFGNSFWSSTSYFNSHKFAFIVEVLFGSGQTVSHIDKSLVLPSIYSRCVRDAQ
ncbi:MAG: Unknown protein [uncultured Sulfurovum sp.]|uniref:Lcl C-terminal domain-containing protein n=1 Tax=uncultured Sulfurovum sp. TaxID=269237 RepID=A0A6S6S8B7_9BACT|nr:MAG: Unknown protein [uncultured Sulfurovum sp.]